MTQENTSKKSKKWKIILPAVLIPLLAVTGFVYILFLRIGIFQYPNWYLRASFRANKQYFDTIVTSGECDRFASGMEYGIDEITDPEMKAAVQKLCADGIWSFDKKYRQNYSGGQKEISSCVFYPKNFSDYDKQMIIYAKDEDSLYYDDDYIQHIDGNWYYVHYHDDDPWDKGG